jgi:four helix bundle protein
MQNADLRSQNDNPKTQKETFKQAFNKRLIYFSLNVIKLCQEARKDRNLSIVADQLVRSATSIGANIVEAKASSSKREYLRYFEIALKSNNETIYWLILLRESSPILQDKVGILQQEATEISKILASGILTMKNKKSAL